MWKPPEQIVDSIKQCWIFANELFVLIIALVVPLNIHQFDGLSWIGFRFEAALEYLLIWIVDPRLLPWPNVNNRETKVSPKLMSDIWHDPTRDPPTNQPIN